MISGKKVFIAVDETMDERDNSVLNIIVGKSIPLSDVVFSFMNKHE